MRALVIFLLAACGSSPPLTLEFRLTPGEAQACIATSGPMGGQPTTSCSDVTMLCDAVLSIRIFPPSDPTAPYISVCKQLTGKKDVCSIAGVDLPTPVVPVPEQRLRVEMAVYPAYKLAKDADGNFLCPTNVAFAANGFPVEHSAPCDDAIMDPTDPMYCPPYPAIGGSAMYTPGDPETVVDLGCTQIGLLTDRTTCTGVNEIAVNATVDDFDTAVPVTPTLADRLAVSIGEPKASGQDYVLNPSDTRPLQRTVIQPIPAWSANIDLKLMTFACIEVLEDSGLTSATLLCDRPMPPITALDLTGIRLQKGTLLQVLQAENLTVFPDRGIVIGMVLDDLGSPLPNVTVMATAGTMGYKIDYLTSDRQNVVTGGTTSSGIFVSTDAPFGTVFSAFHANTTINPAYGGLVANKVTIVILQEKQPSQ